MKVGIINAVRMHPDAPQPIQDVYRDFLYVQQVARIVDGLRDLVGEPIVPPTASRYVLAKADEDGGR